MGWGKYTTYGDALSQCSGKQPFDSAVIARLAIREKKGRKTSEPPLRAYRCPQCGKWHVGGQIPRNQKRELFVPTKGRRKFNPMKELLDNG